MRYSERASMAVRYASQEAARLGHDHVSTGHLLLGLIRQGDGAAIDILNDSAVDLEKLKSEVEGMIEDSGRGTVIGKLQLSIRAKDVLRFAEEESQSMGHKYLGTEHILLGLIREQEGVAAKALTKLGLDIQRARAIALMVEVQEEEPVETITFQNTGMSVSAYNPTATYNTETHQEKDILNLEEASELLKIDVGEMEELLKTENIPARKIGGQWKFSRSALLKWLGDGNSKDYA
jgi:ATP-dependent Clp protease ATP-binding subunit ClpC